MHIILLLALVLRIVDSVSQHPRVLVISFDGFRYNFFEKDVTPTLERLKTKGTHAEYMRNVFVTKTYPNHHSIATGLFPEVHGVVANKFYDPRLERIISYCEDMWNFDNRTVPIWILNEQAGAGRHSGTYMWPGGEFAYQNVTPTFYTKYNSSVKWTVRVDTVLSWFLNTSTPANLVMMYLEEPDKHSHSFGPESNAVRKQLQRLDNITDYLHRRLLQSGLAVNVFLLSDHGMTTVTSERIINITRCVSNTTLVAGSSPVLHFIPASDQEDELYSCLKKGSTHYNYTVYHKDELLDRWHYKHNIRIPPVLAVADEGYAFDDLLEGNKPLVLHNNTFGVHGYDNALASMHPFFMAWGPRIKRNHTIEPFDSVDLYSLFSELLDLEAPSTNGSLANVVGMLRIDNLIPVSAWTLEIVGVVAVSVLLMAFAGCITVKILKRRRNDSATRSYQLLRTRILSDNESKSIQEEFEGQHLLDNMDLEET